MSINLDFNSEWKSDQLSYFKKYIKNFKKSSPEYEMIKRGINELEKSI